MCFVSSKIIARLIDSGFITKIPARFTSVFRISPVRTAWTHARLYFNNVRLFVNKQKTRSHLARTPFSLWFEFYQPGSLQTRANARLSMSSDYRPWHILKLGMATASSLRHLAAEYISQPTKKYHSPT